jgi:hypothetical protein
MTSLIKAFTSTFPSSCEDVELDLPSLFALKPVPIALIPELKEFLQEENIPADMVEYLQDVTFISTAQEPTTFARLFDDAYNGDDRDRQGRRLKAEMLLINDKSSSNSIVPLANLTGTKTTCALAPMATSIELVSPAFSYSSLSNDTDYESETMTPELGSQVFERVVIRRTSKSRSPSFEKEKDQVKGQGNMLGMGWEGMPVSQR